MNLSARINRVALGALVVGIIGAAGCERAQESADTGIIRHEGAMPSPYAAGPSSKTPQALAAGQWDSPAQMYAATCKGCHDPAIKVGPALFGRNLGTSYISYVARHGRNGMPGFFPSDYSDADLKALAEWIDAQPATPAAQQQGGSH